MQGIDQVKPVQLFYIVQLTLNDLNAHHVPATWVRYKNTILSWLYFQAR